MKINFTPLVYQSKNQFTKKFIEFFKMFEPLFLGLKEYYNHNICHHDINVRNILFKENKFIFIDYGLSFFTTKPNLIIQRMEKEFKMQGESVYMFLMLVCGTELAKVLVMI